MKLNFKRGVTARQMAEMHRHLAEARKSLAAALFLTEETKSSGPCPLTVGSRDALRRAIDALQEAIYSMESTFMRVTNDATAPFAEPSRPTEWLEWLDTQGDE